MVAAALPVLLAFAALPVRVEATACPDATAVEAALAARLAADATGRPPDFAHIWKQDGLVHVDLVNPDGALIAERALPASGTCAELADLLAVVIASWESDVHPAFARPAEATVAPLARVPAAVGSVRPEAASFDLALGAGGTWAESFAAGGSASVTWVPRGQGLGLRMAATIDGPRTVSVGDGEAAWRRWMAGIALDWRRLAGPTAIDLHGGLLLGWLWADGSGFGRDQSATSVAPAVALGGRLAWWGTRHFALWVGLEGVRSLRAQTLFTSPDGLTRAVPAFQVIGQLGLAVGQTANRR
jgi:hypothetical protein